MTQSSHNDRLAPLPFFLLVASVFAVYVGYGIVLSVLPFLLERLLDDGARFSLAWHTLGSLVGPILGGWLVDVSGAVLSRPFLVAATAGALVWLAVWFGLPESGGPDSAAVAERVDVQHAAGSVNAVLLLALLGMFGLGSFEVAIALQGARVLAFDPRQIGALFMVCSLVRCWFRSWSSRPW
jgi:MFS family permease